MCDDLSNALEIKEHIVEADKRDIKINARLDKIDERLERIEKKSEDATKWQLVVQICQALFGDIKRTITTFIMIGVLLGLVHFKDILDIIKALVI